LDKIAKYEGWRWVTRDGKAAGSVIDRVAELESKLRLEITVQRKPPVER
jgi:hypothetical protein